MTGTQQLIGWVCSLLTVLAGYALYLAATYGFSSNKENKTQ